MSNLERRIFLTVVAVGLTTAILYILYGYEVALIATVISAGVAPLTLTLIYQRHSEAAVERWANDLSSKVARAWENRRAVLLSDTGELKTRFERAYSLEVGRLPEQPDSGTWNSTVDDFQSLPERRLVILGEWGAGKTLMSLQLAIGMVQSRNRRLEASRGRTDSRDPEHIPVPISVAGWSGERTLIDWLIQRLQSDYHISRRRADALVSLGYIVPMLDDLDETAQRSYPIATLRILHRLNASYGGTAFTGHHQSLVLTCGQALYSDLPYSGSDPRLDTRLVAAAVVNMLPLTDTDVINCIARRAEASRHLGNLYEMLLTGDYPNIAAAISNPLILALTVRVARSGRLNLDRVSNFNAPDEVSRYMIAEYLPSTVLLYPKAYGRKRLGRLLKLQSRYYRPEAVERWLYYIANHLHRRDSASTLNESYELQLDPNTIWEIAQNHQRPVRNVHIWVAISAALVAGSFGAEMAAGMAGVACWVVTTAVALAFALRVALPRTPKLSRFDFRQLTDSKTAVCLLPMVLMTGLLAGGLAFHLSHRISIGFTEGAIAAAVAVLLAGRSRGPARAVEPLDGLRNDLRFGLVAGTVGAIAIGFPDGITGGLWSYLHLTSALSKPGSELAAFLVAIPCGVVLGSGGWVRAQLAAWLAKDEFLPSRPLKFFQWAEVTGLLRATGNTYRFRHECLRIWWSENHPDVEELPLNDSDVRQRPVRSDSTLKLTVLALFGITVLLAALTILSSTRASTTTYFSSTDLFADLAGAGTLLGGVAAMLVFALGYRDRRKRTEKQDVKDVVGNAIEHIDHSLRPEDIHALADLARALNDNQPRVKKNRGPRLVRLVRSDLQSAPEADTDVEQGRE